MNQIPSLAATLSAAPVSNYDRASLERKFIEAFAFDRVEELIEACAKQARILGQKYIVWQISWPSQLRSLESIGQLIKALNRAADACHAEGFTLGYHNHSHEFASVGNDIPYDLIVQGTDPSKVKLEMDLAWTVNAKIDPVVYFRKYPGRFRMVHMKDIGSDGKVRDPDSGIVPFRRLSRQPKKLASNTSMLNMTCRLTRWKLRSRRGDIFSR